MAEKLNFGVIGWCWQDSLAGENSNYNFPTMELKICLRVSKINSTLGSKFLDPPGLTEFHKTFSVGKLVMPIFFKNYLLPVPAAKLKGKFEFIQLKTRLQI